MTGTVDRDYWMGDLASLFAEANMTGKVVDVDTLIDFINQNAYEPVEPPAPPPPVGPLRLVWPAPDPKVVTQWYGINGQFYPGQKGHEGIDLRAVNGAQIVAAAAGRVYRVETSPASGPYGTHVRIEHNRPEGTFKTIYAHFQSAQVAEGDEVEAGQPIGLADNTGNSSGAHLHLTLKKVGHGSNWLLMGDIVNPVPYMPDLFPGQGWRLDVGGNFRTQPQTGYNLIRYISAGAHLAFTGKFEDDWWQAIYGGATGWFWNPGYKAFPL